jgi:hypothetical protein
MTEIAVLKWLDEIVHRLRSPLSADLVDSGWTLEGAQTLADQLDSFRRQAALVGGARKLNSFGGEK